MLKHRGEECAVTKPSFLLFSSSSFHLPRFDRGLNEMPEANINSIILSIAPSFRYAHFYVYTFRINNEQAGNILRARRFTLLTLKSSSDLEHFQYSSSVSIESSFRVSQIPDIVLTKIEGKKNAFDVICTKEARKEKRRHVSDETRGRNAWNFGKMRTDLRTSLISLSTRAFEAKVERRRGRERRREEKNGRWDGGLSAVCRIFMQMRLMHL